MQINKKWDLLIYISFSMFVGILVGSIIITKGYAKPSFFDCTFIQVFRLSVMIFLGCYVAYWTSIKVNRVQKKKELSLELIKEAKELFKQQNQLILSCIQNNENSEKGKLVLSGFKKISNKIATLKVICNKISNELSIDNIENDFKELKELFGEKFYSGGFLEDEKHQMVKTFDKFEKQFDDLRINILV